MQHNGIGTDCWFNTTEKHIHARIKLYYVNECHYLCRINLCKHIYIYIYIYITSMYIPIIRKTKMCKVNHAMQCT